MAIARMAKVLAIVEEENRENLMQAFQKMQNIQVKTIDSELLEKEPKLDSKKLTEYMDQLENVRSAKKYLESYLSSESFKDKYLTPLPEMSMEEIEKSQIVEETREITQKIWQQKKTLEEINSQIQINENEAEFYHKWRNLKALPEYHNEYRYTRLLLGTIPQTADNEYYDVLKQDNRISIEEIYQSKDEIGLTIAFDKDDSFEVNQFLNQNRFQALDYRFKDLPAKLLEAAHLEAETLRKKAQALRKELGSYRKEYNQLKIAEEVFYAKAERQKATELGLQKSDLFALEGWIEESKAQASLDQVRQALNGEVYLDYVTPTDEEHEEVPIQLKNHPLIEPFETVTSMYGLPAYKGFDPTSSLMPYYWIFFGMMIADLGYGILLWLGTFIPLKFFNIEAGMRKNLRFFHLLSYAVLLWGLIYGSFFGESLPFKLLSPTEDVIQVLALSIGLGFIQIIHGLFLNTKLNWVSDRLGAIKDGLAWIVMLFGFLISVLGPMLFNLQTLKQLGLYIAGFAAITILIVASLKGKNKLIGFGAGLYDLYGISSYLGDLVSYSRLMALGIAGGSIALAFNILVAYLPPVARFSVGIILIIVLQLFNFGLSVLSAYVHSARLIFVEFFGKFYEAGGQAFAPLKYLGKYINIK
ncbi:V-type ATP synthase subunit I [Facklamia miroungae]|uniref:V/A-type H+-transporting ATPase subunit I n=1 Tax=Facklamia miroungae TaxID=120956 RepID=A0A1G7RJL7_9LACT|nr:V-type ATP synthase subunit I [Facklamia miroungae]NKZ29387.1 V-type ATP synthase subunit I [Facklamia miroungae]SDG10978.1 V/A-type H+-transporting ATPase subunit I [Facklamia miroungae]